MTPRRVCYTALIGSHDLLAEQPTAATSQCRYICFTDDPELVSSSWEVVLVDRRFSLDHVRSARRLKILGHDLLEEFDESLWIDAKVLLVEKPETILDDWLAEHDVAIPWHSYRADLVDEFRAVVTDNLDEPTRVWEQLAHYELSHPDLLDQRPLWTGIMARRRGAELTRVMTTWYEEVLRYSRRDQLSVQVALSGSGLSVQHPELNNFGSPLHRWPYPPGQQRVPVGGLGSWQTSAEPLRARVRQLTDQVRLLQQAQLDEAGREEQRRAVDEERDDLLTSLIVREQVLAAVPAPAPAVVAAPEAPQEPVWPDWAARLRASDALAPARRVYHWTRRAVGRE